jgi:hypothetical protein
MLVAVIWMTIMPPMPDRQGKTMAQSNLPGKLSGAALRLQQGIQFKRTIIPPMLTCGVLLAAFGIWILCGGQDMPLSGQTGLAAALLGLGLLVLAAGVFTMLQVRNMRKRRERPV